MRFLSLRLILSLVVAIAVVSLLFSVHRVAVEKRNLRRDLGRRAEVLAESLQDSAEPLLERGSHKELLRVVERFGNRERLTGVVVYNKRGELLAASSWVKSQPVTDLPMVSQALAKDQAQGDFVVLGATPSHVYALPLHRQGEMAGVLAVIHDASYIQTRADRVWRETFIQVLVEGTIVILLTLLILRWSLQGPIAKTAQWIRALRAGRALPHPSGPELQLFHPFAKEVTNLAASLEAARAAAVKEAQLRQAGDSLWTAERLSVFVSQKLSNARLFVISNREPYTHVRKGKEIEVVIPPSGLVTAMEPILQACDGTWIAHGDGTADREVVDRQDSLRVPPEEPKYTLKRVWLTKEEEQGYYFGFSNEGMWPLCHIAHTRPLFREQDWAAYRLVNQKFCDAAIEAMAETEQPVVLVQDYHFALLPRLIKQQRPDARVAIFWHIPWPNPEAFAICPWRAELLDGLLGADLVGFHIQDHCDNFLETVDHTLECRISDHSVVDRKTHRTLVKPFPISVVFPGDSPCAGDEDELERITVLRELGSEALFLGVGVDRVDYTKGILERFAAIECFLEKYPAYTGQFSFIQVAAPSRTHIKRYHDLLAEVEAEAERINWKFQSSKWKPILFLKRQHTHREIRRLYRATDFCLVTSLHDGMNLVAKEFVASRTDEQGVLVLSQFAGAARELSDALVINPYDIGRTAEAIRYALEMDPTERQTRMRRLRQVVKEQNVYRWASDLISRLCDIRPEIAEPIVESVQPLSKANRMSAS
ncbi:MAG TPA: trehalose-6-phosphate synthase [Terriglobales bacterium]|nr:trehalose-6-phosphate synthase [Terriglobales bacterium]